MNYVLLNSTYEGVVHYEAIERAFHSIRMRHITPSLPARNISEFPHAPKILENWCNLFLWGDTNVGKTAYARSLLPNAMVVRHTDQLRHCDFSKG